MLGGDKMKHVVAILAGLSLSVAGLFTLALHHVVPDTLLGFTTTITGAALTGFIGRRFGWIDGGLMGALLALPYGYIFHLIVMQNPGQDLSIWAASIRRIEIMFTVAGVVGGFIGQTLYGKKCGSA